MSANGLWRRSHTILFSSKLQSHRYGGDHKRRVDVCIIAFTLALLLGSHNLITMNQLEL